MSFALKIDGKVVSNLSIPEAVALRMLLEDANFQKLRDGLFKSYMEVANCTLDEAKAICGPLLLDGMIRQARELAKGDA
jgi:hypothetical protein